VIRGQQERSAPRHGEDESVSGSVSMPAQPLMGNQEAEMNIYPIETTWSDEEFAGIDLGDKRLHKRLFSVSADLAAQPQAPINQACQDWAATKAAYRLFENEKAQPALILSPHQQQTRKRMVAYERVLAVQDTALFNYTAHPMTQGLGPIGTPEQGLQGLVMHSTLIQSLPGLPLGLATQEIWAREEVVTEEPQQQQRPIEEKESCKWITALRGTVESALADVEVVTVCDREADVYEFFQEAEPLGTKLLVRSTYNRLLVGEGKLRSVMKAHPVAGHIRVEVPAHKEQPARKAFCDVRFRAVTLRPPYRPKKFGLDLSPIPLDVVWVHEVNPPAHVKEPLDWMLFTTVPVTSFEEARERIRWYKVRWNIEVWHNVLKSGGTVEECRLETGETLSRYLTLMRVIAWRVFWMMPMNRHHPESPCDMVLAEHEWKALYGAIHRTTLLPETRPTVGQVIRGMAQLGGFLGRKHDFEPGVTVLWRGWQRLQDLSMIWRVVHDAGTS
jgi:hypothetical protein